MKKVIFTCFLAVLCTISFAQKSCPDTVSDQDGYVYHTISIGNQCWLKENIRAKYDVNGILIPKGDVEAMVLEHNPKAVGRCYPDGDQANHDDYGYLYTWEAARKVCPKGWHLPTHVEWSELQYYLMSNEFCGNSRLNVAKSIAAKEGWDESLVPYSVGNRISHNNSTDFSAMPAGEYVEGYQDFGRNAYFWCADEFQDEDAYAFVISCACTDPHMLSFHRSSFRSVRCMRDENVSATESAKPARVSENDAKASDKQGKAVAEPQTKEAAPAEETIDPNADYIIYELKEGDQLGKIGRKYGFTGKQLQDFNNLTEEQTRRMQIGQKIKIPKK